MSDLVNMTKDGVVLAIHPTCVAAHAEAGWVKGGKLPPDEPAETAPVKAPAKAADAPAADKAKA